MFASLLYIMVQYMKEYIAYVVSTGSCLASLDVGIPTGLPQKFIASIKMIIMTKCGAKVNHAAYGRDSYHAKADIKEDGGGFNLHAQSRGPMPTRSNLARFKGQM